MKKKLLCGILACMMTFSAAFPLVACKDRNPDQGQTENNGENPEGQNPNDGQEPEGQEPEGQKPEGQQPEGGETPGDEDEKNPDDKGPEQDQNPPKEEVEPGTVITDEETKTLLFNSLSETEIGGITFSASADLALSGGEERSTKVTCEGSFLVEEDKIEADLNAFLENEGDEADRYLLFFMRGGDVYYLLGEWESEEKIDFSAIKEQLKAEEGGLVLSKGELPKGLSTAAETTAIVKMIKNLPALFDGTVTKTEGGYSLVFDVGEAAGSFFKGIGSVLKEIDVNHAITLGGIFTQPYFASSLEKLLHGVTAVEFKAAAESFLPEEVAENLPEPVKGATALSYAETLMRSGNFYKALTKEETGWEKWKTFSSVPLEEFLSLFTGEKFTFGEKKLEDTFKEYTENLAKEAANYFFDLLSVDAGEISDESLLVSLRFEFDNDKKLMSLSIDALSEGTRTIPPKSEEPGDEEPGEDEPGDEEPGDETNPGGEDEGGEGTNPGDDGGDVTPGEGDDGGDVAPGEGDDGGDVTPGEGDDGGDVTPGEGDDGGDVTPGEGDDGGDVTPGEGDDGDETNPDGDGDPDMGEDGGMGEDGDPDMGDDSDMDNDGGMGEDGGTDMDNEGPGGTDMGDGAEDNMDSNDDMGTGDDATDGSGDNMPNGKRKSGDTKGTVIRTMKRRKEAEGEKVNFRGSLKFEAVSSSEKELFDLTGCKYETEEGEGIVKEDVKENDEETDEESAE